MRSMFGGLGLYCDGQIFTIYSSNQQRLYLKASGALVDSLAAEGSVPFEHRRKSGKVARLPYWSLPEAALDDPEDACAWARRALAAADPAFP